MASDVAGSEAPVLPTHNPPTGSCFSTPFKASQTTKPYMETSSVEQKRVDSSHKSSHEQPVPTEAYSTRGSVVIHPVESPFTTNPTLAAASALKSSISSSGTVKKISPSNAVAMTPIPESKSLSTAGTTDTLNRSSRTVHESRSVAVRSPEKIGEGRRSENCDGSSRTDHDSHSAIRNSPEKAGAGKDDASTTDHGSPSAAARNSPHTVEEDGGDESPQQADTASKTTDKDDPFAKLRRQYSDPFAKFGSSRTHREYYRGNRSAAVKDSLDNAEVSRDDESAQQTDDVSQMADKNDPFAKLRRQYRDPFAKFGSPKTNHGSRSAAASLEVGRKDESAEKADDASQRTGKSDAFSKLRRQKSDPFANLKRLSSKRQRSATDTLDGRSLPSAYSFQSMLGEEGVALFNSLLGLARRREGLTRAWQFKAYIIKFVIRARLLFVTGQIPISHLAPFDEPFNRIGTLLLEVLETKKSNPKLVDSGVKPTLFCGLLRDMFANFLALVRPYLPDSLVNKADEAFSFFAGPDFVLGVLNEKAHDLEKRRLTSVARRLFRPLLLPICKQRKCNLSQVESRDKFAGSLYCAKHHQERYEKMLSPPNFDMFVNTATSDFDSFPDYVIQEKSGDMNLINFYLRVKDFRLLEKVAVRTRVAESICTRYLDPGAEKHFAFPAELEVELRSGLEKINEARSLGQQGLKPGLFGAMEKSLEAYLKLQFEQYIQTDRFRNKLAAVELPQSVLDEMKAAEEKQTEEDLDHLSCSVISFSDEVEIYILPFREEPGRTVQSTLVRTHLLTDNFEAMAKEEREANERQNETWAVIEKNKREATKKRMKWEGKAPSTFLGHRETDLESGALEQKAAQDKEPRYMTLSRENSLTGPLNLDLSGHTAHGPLNLDLSGHTAHELHTPFPPHSLKKIKSTDSESSGDELDSSLDSLAAAGAVEDPPARDKQGVTVTSPPDSGDQSGSPSAESESPGPEWLRQVKKKPPLSPVMEVPVKEGSRPPHGSPLKPDQPGEDPRPSPPRASPPRGPKPPTTQPPPPKAVYTPAPPSTPPPAKANSPSSLGAGAAAVGAKLGGKEAAREKQWVSPVGGDAPARPGC